MSLVCTVHSTWLPNTCGFCHADAVALGYKNLNAIAGTPRPTTIQWNSPPLPTTARITLPHSAIGAPPPPPSGPLVYNNSGSVLSWGPADPLIAEKQALWDPYSGWKVKSGKFYSYRTRVDHAERLAKSTGCMTDNLGQIMYWTNGQAQWQTRGESVEVQLSDGSWYYPWGQPRPEPETVLPPSCQHEYVDVGFMHPKVVCKFCDSEKPVDTDREK